MSAGTKSPKKLTLNESFIEKFKKSPSVVECFTVSTPHSHATATVKTKSVEIQDDKLVFKIIEGSLWSHYGENQHIIWDGKKLRISTSEQIKNSFLSQATIKVA